MESFHSSLTAHDLGKFTRRAKQALHYAAEEARVCKQRSVGAEHVLLGLIQEGEGLAGHALKQLGITLSQARQVVESGAEANAEPAASELQFGDEVRHVFASA